MEVHYNEVVSSDKINTKDIVCLLLKSYGLKQANREQYLELIKLLKRLGFEENAADKCIFDAKIEEVLIYVAIFVDDGLISSSSLELMDVLFSLSEEFDITIGDGFSYIGMQIERDNIDGEVVIHQSKYVNC